MKNVFDSSDGDLIGYLLGSDYEENFTEDEYKYLLKKFKQFYRNSLLKNEQLLHQIDNIKKETKDELLRKDVGTQSKDKKIKEIQLKLSFFEETINRKLTIKERLTGRINI